MAELATTLHLYRVLAVAKVRADWQYRSQFLLYMTTQFFITFLDFLQIAVIFGAVDSLAGWSLLEVVFLYATSGMAFYLGDAFISQVERVGGYIKAGTFDALLIRPAGTLVQICANDFAFRRLGKLLQASIVMVIVLARLDVEWTPGRLVVFALMIPSGTVIFSSIWVIGASITFWTVDSGELANTFTYGGNFATQYPLDILGTWLRRFLTLVVPTAFVNYFPALYILGKPDPFGAPGWVRFISPLVALTMAVAARAAWTGAVRHYRSTGS